MRHSIFFLVIMASQAAIYAAGDHNVRFKTVTYAEVHYLFLQKYQTLFQELCVLARDPQAYQSLESLQEIPKRVSLLAQFSESDAAKRKQVPLGSMTAKIPYVQGAYTEQDFAWMLLGYAVSRCNKIGIQFLQKKYQLDLKAETLEGSSALQWFGKEDGYVNKPAAIVTLFMEDYKLDPNYIAMLDASGQNVLHRIAHRIVENHTGFREPARAFDAQLQSGAIKLPKDATKEQELRYYTEARETALKDWGPAFGLLWAHNKSALSVADKDGKTVIDILKGCSCKGQEGVCKKIIDTLSGNQPVAPQQEQKAKK